MAAVPAHAAVLHSTLTRYLRLSNSDPLCQLRRPRSVVSLNRGHFFSLGLYLFMVSAPLGSTTENLETRSSTAWLRRWPSVVRRNPVLIKARLDARRRPGRERRRLSLSLSLVPFILTAVHRVSICPNLYLHLRPTRSIGVSVSLRRLLPAFPHSAQLDPAAPRHAARPLPVLVAPRYDRARTKEKIKKTSKPAPSVHCAAYTRRGEPVVPACNGTRAADDDSMPLLFPFFLLSSAAASLSPSSP